MLKLKGILPAVLTPMTPEEEINEKELRNQVNRFIRAGVHGLFILGTNSEFYALDYEEKLEIVRIVTDECNGRLPICAGTGCISTRDTVRLSRKVAEMGVDAISVVTPYYAAVSQDELYDHYAEIADAVDLPVILYNIPMRTGNAIEPKTIGKLARIKNIAGVKDTSGNFNNTLGYIEEGGEGFSVFAGSDTLVLWTLAAGGAGAVSGLANVIPEVMVSIYELWKCGDMEGAKRAQNAIRPLRNCLQMGNPNSIIKRAANLAGQPVGPARRPASGCTDAIDAQLKSVLKLYL